MIADIQREILDCLSLLEIYKVECGKTRIGGPNDGGYVMAKDFARNSICYSIGVGPQVIWDSEMARRGMHIYQYDHTVEGLPEENSRFNFFKIGIGPDLADSQLITLEEMLKRNGHLDRDEMLLKMDVEGAEWDVLDRLPSGLLNKFDQLVIEFHGLEYLAEETFRRRAERVFRSINASHRPVHVHGNNYAMCHFIAGVAIPGVLEVTFCRRGRFNFSPSDEIFPTELDMPCYEGGPDIFLGRFQFGRR